jgi:hypothetical protein
VRSARATGALRVDPDNLGIGDINYWVVKGNVGKVEQFIKIGGASIHARRIGSPLNEDKP